MRCVQRIPPKTIWLTLIALLCTLPMTALAFEPSVIKSTLLGTDADWWQEVRTRIRHEEYRFITDGETFFATNRAQGMRVLAHKQGLWVFDRSDQAWTWTWRTLALQRLHHSIRIPMVSPTGGDCDYQIRPGATSKCMPLLEYNRPDFLEWYANRPDGLEQGFVIEQRLAGRGPVALTGSIGGDLTGRPDPSGDKLIFSQDGRDLLIYHSLVVTDTLGRKIPARLELVDQTAAIVIDDAAAVYPLFVDPKISTTTDWNAEPDQAGAEFGMSVSSAGDVNGDRFDDIIVGAFNYDRDFEDEGAAFVFYGGKGGPSTTADWMVTSGQKWPDFALTVSGGCDFNHDGFDDVMIGAPRFDNDQYDEGRVFVFHGSADGLPDEPNWLAEVNQLHSRFGSSVACAGDVNGDQYDDIIMGAFWYDDGDENEGAAFVAYGSEEGLGNPFDWWNTPDQAGARLGISVAGAGDVNGDGFDDIIIGAERFANGEEEEGRAYVFHGSADGPSSEPDWTAESDQSGARLGNSVSSAGDVNGDNFDDVIIGAYWYTTNESREGAAYVFYGSNQGLSDSRDWFAAEGFVHDEFGFSVAGGGDVNGDGFDDVIVGAQRYDTVEAADQGAVFLYLGSADGLTASFDWMVMSGQEYSYFGASVAFAGDVNDDRYDDLLVGAPKYFIDEKDEGWAFLFLGGPYEGSIDDDDDTDDDDDDFFDDDDDDNQGCGGGCGA